MTKQTEPTQAKIDAAVERRANIRWINDRLRWETPTGEEVDCEELEKLDEILADAYLAHRAAESARAERDARLA